MTIRLVEDVPEGVRWNEEIGHYEEEICRGCGAALRLKACRCATGGEWSRYREAKNLAARSVSLDSMSPVEMMAEAIAGVVAGALEHDEGCDPNVSCPHWSVTEGPRAIQCALEHYIAEGVLVINPY